LLLDYGEDKLSGRGVYSVNNTYPLRTTTAISLFGFILSRLPFVSVWLVWVCGVGGAKERRGKEQSTLGVRSAASLCVVQLKEI
jgi:hypothetical protein